MGEETNACMIFGWGPARKNQYERPIHYWEDNIKMNLQ
jgi:hypothetical protein